MQRYTKKAYQRHMLVLVVIYIALVLFEWPQVHHATNLAWKIALALLPAAPVIGMFWLMAKRVMHSDELEQRLHLMALSVATGVVGVLSMVCGFLYTASVIRLDGDIVFWVFPALCFTYGAARWLFRQRYGGMGCE